MAKSKRLIVQLGDGGDPETFAHTCGASTFGVNLSNNTGEVTTLDCDNPLGAPAELSRYLESQDTSATISGTVTTEAWPTWRAWADSGEVKNAKMLMDESAANNGGFWVVPTILQQLELSKENGGFVQFSATLVGAGKRVWTAAS